MWTLSFAAPPTLAARISTVGFKPPGGLTAARFISAILFWVLVEIQVASERSFSLSKSEDGDAGVGVQPVFVTSAVGNAIVRGSEKQSVVGSVPPFGQLP